MVELDVENLCGAGYGAKSPKPIYSRNGYHERLWRTRAGNIELRQHSYFPGLLGPRRRHWPR